MASFHRTGARTARAARSVPEYLSSLPSLSLLKDRPLDYLLQLRMDSSLVMYCDAIFLGSRKRIPMTIKLALHLIAPDWGNGEDGHSRPPKYPHELDIRPGDQTVVTKDERQSQCIQVVGPYHTRRSRHSPYPCLLPQLDKSAMFTPFLTQHPPSPVHDPPPAAEGGDKWTWEVPIIPRKMAVLWSLNPWG